ncbi:MAG: chemotaxis protein CheX [Planctomycetota bacterium]
MDAFHESIEDSFSQMAGIEVERVRVLALDGPFDDTAEDAFALTVIMGWTGPLQGTVAITLSEQAALDWTTAMLGMTAEKIDGDVFDAIQELGNLVIGSAKSRLEMTDLAVSLPLVLPAGLASMGSRSERTDLRMTYAFNGHKVCVFASIDQK